VYSQPASKIVLRLQDEAGGFLKAYPPESKQELLRIGSSLPAITMERGFAYTSLNSELSQGSSWSSLPEISF